MGKNFARNTLAVEYVSNYVPPQTEMQRIIAEARKALVTKSR